MASILGSRILGYFETLKPLKLYNLIKTNYDNLSANLLDSKITYEYIDKVETLLDYDHDTRNIPVIQQLLTIVSGSNVGFNPLSVINSFLGDLNNISELLDIPNSQLKNKYNDIVNYLGSFESFYLLLQSKSVTDLYIDTSIMGNVYFYDNLIENSDIDITSKYNDETSLILAIFIKTLLHRNISSKSSLSEKLIASLFDVINQSSYSADFTSSLFDSGSEIVDDITSYIVTGVIKFNSEIIKTRPFVFDNPGDTFNGLEDGLEYDIYQFVKNGTTVNTDNLISYYTMDSIVGSTLNDSGSGGYNGTVIGATITSGKFNNSLNFNGSSQYIDCGIGLGNELGATVSTISISLWINANNTTINRGIFDIGLFDTTLGRLYFKLESNELSIFMNGGAFLIDIPYTYISEWHHIAFTYNGITGTVYLDSVEIETKLYTSTLDLTSKKVIIGAYQNTSQSFDGNIDEVRIYNKTLSHNEIIELYLENSIGSNSVLSELVRLFRNYTIPSSEKLFLWIDYYYSLYTAIEYLPTLYNEVKVAPKTIVDDELWILGDTLESYFIKYEDSVYDTITENINIHAIEELQNNLWLTWLYKEIPLHYLNVFVSTQSYWLRNKIEDIPSNIHILNESNNDIIESWIGDLSFDSGVLNSALETNYINETNLTTSNATKTSASLFTSTIIYNFIESVEFKDFLINSVLEPIETIIKTDYQLLEFNMYENVERLKIFFKAILNKEIFNDRLFTSISSTIQSSISTIFANHGSNPIIELDDTLSGYKDTEVFHSKEYVDLFNKFFLNVKVMNFSTNYLNDLKI